MNLEERIVESRAVEVLQTLVRIRTALPRGDEMDCVKYLLSLFPKNAVESHVLDHGGNRASLMLTLPGMDRSRNVALVGHMDTLGISSPDEWEHPPFAADYVDGRIYGNGTISMKGGLTAMVMSALYFVESGRNPPVDLHLCFSADEEMNGIGAGGLLRSGLLDGLDELIIAEPTNERLGLAEKGAIWLKVSLHGSEAHGAIPDRGVNAIESFMDLVYGIRGIFDGERRHRLLGNSTCTITCLNGGTDPNVVPDHAEGILDIRVLPCVEHEAFMVEVDRIAEALMRRRRPLQISFEEINYQSPVGMDRKSPMVDRFRAIYNEMDMKCEETGVYPFTDASRLVPHLGVPFVIVGPGDDQRGHQKDESISVASVVRMAAVYVRYVLGMAVL